MDEMQGTHAVSRPAASNLRQPHTLGNMRCANGDTHSLATGGDMTRDTVTSLHVGIGTVQVIALLRNAIRCDAEEDAVNRSYWQVKS